MRNLAAVLTLFLALLALGGCITDPVTGRRTFGMPGSTEAEATQGMELRPQILQQFDGPYPDEEAQRYLSSIVLPMARSSVRPELPWEFSILNTSVPNAFAVPGGQVFVTRGLLARLEDEAEFAVVMGHEIGHVEHRHVAQQQGQQLLLGGVTAAIGAKWGESGGKFAQAIGGVLLLKYSRSDESESDIRGVENSYRSGYDPREGADVFRVFLQMKEEEGATGQPNWLSSHPTDASRIEHVLELSRQKDPRLAGTDPVPGLKVTTPEWQRLMAKLRDVQRSYDRHDAALKRAGAAGATPQSVRAIIPDLQRVAAELPGHALPAVTLGKALVIAGDVDAGTRELERAASMRQGLADPEVLLGYLALERDQWDQAASHADRALAILPGDYRSLAVRGEANWNRGRRAEAESDFQAVVASAPQESEQYRQATARLGATATPEPQPARTRRRPR